MTHFLQGINKFVGRSVNATKGKLFPYGINTIKLNPCGINKATLIRCDINTGKLFSRNITTGKYPRLMAAGKGEKEGEKDSHHGSADLWKKITIFGVFPALIVIAVLVSNSIKEHPHERAEFHPYEHMRMRGKQYPWDKDGSGRTFFHNPEVNALPDGYEDEINSEEEPEE